MVSHTTWIVFAHLVLFNPQGNGNENELASWQQNEFNSQSQCYDFLQQNYVKIDATLQQAEEFLDAPYKVYNPVGIDLITQKMEGRAE